MTRPVTIEAGPFATVREAHREMDAIFTAHPMDTFETSLGLARTEAGWVIRGARRATPNRTA